MFAESGPLCDRFAIRPPHRCFENSATHATKEGLRNYEGRFVRRDLFMESRDGRLIRVLQRMESSGILSKHEMKVCEVQREEARAGLSADFVSRIATSERADQSRLKRQRT